MACESLDTALRQFQETASPQDLAPTQHVTLLTLRPVTNIIVVRLLKYNLIFLSEFLVGRFYFLDRHVLLKE